MRVKNNPRCRVTFNMATMYLGAMCRHGHEYVKTNKTLRYKKSRRRCVECMAAHGRRAYRNNRKKVIARASMWQRENPEAVKRNHARDYQRRSALFLARRASLFQSDPDYRAKRSARARLNYEAHRTEILARARLNYEAHRTEILARMALRYKNDPDYRAKKIAAATAHHLKRRKKP